jgi:hypothetical protein
LEGFLNKTVEKNAVSATLLEHDAKGIEDCLYLNKLLNETNKNLKDNDSDKKHTLVNDSFRQFESPESKKNFKDEFDLSPEHLKKKFGIDHMSDSQNLSKSLTSRSRHMSPGLNVSRKKKSNDEFELSGMTLENELNKNGNLKSQIEYLKLIIFSMDNKLREYHYLKRDYALLKLELEKSEEARKELQETIKETTNDLRKEMKNLNENYSRTLAEKSGLTEKMKENEKR